MPVGALRQIPAVLAIRSSVRSHQGRILEISFDALIGGAVTAHERNNSAAQAT
jgi:hypothetical protein